MLKNTVSDQIAKKRSNVAFVFSCPGKEEQKVGAPCQGQTGSNLNTLISILHRERPDLFPYEKKENYTIANASTIVHYNSEGGDGRTEPTVGEIKTPENIKRLKHSLSGKSVILCMGAKAEIAVKQLASPAHVVTSSHLGFQSLNTRFPNSSLKSSTGSDRAEERLRLVAGDILAQI